MAGENDITSEATDLSVPTQTTLLEQLKIATDLYKHEDNLNWTKLNNLFYINAGLWAILGFIIEFGGVNSSSFPINLNFIMTMVSIIGIIVSIALGIALWCGVRYMQHRKETVTFIEEKLIPYGGQNIVSSSQEILERKRFFQQSPTTLVLKSVPVLFIIVWIIVLFMT